MAKIKFHQKRGPKSIFLRKKGAKTKSSVHDRKSSKGRPGAVGEC
jgi:hypothetical protein